VSNSLAIAAVTSTIRYVLDRSLQQPHAGPVGGANVTTLRPQELASSEVADTSGINVFCFQATPNHAWNLTDLPTRRPDGSMVQRPVAAVDLHYLLTCYGDEPSLEPQRLLGRVVGALAATSVLTRDVVTAALALYDDDTETAFLASSDLADEVELVKLAPMTLSLEEMSKLWGVLDTPYLLSLTYLATVVLIVADLTPSAGLPVARRSISVNAAGPPRLAELATDPPGEAAGAGAAVVLRGTGLAGTSEVRIGPATVAPDGEPTGLEVRAVLDDSVPAGVHAVQVRERSAAGPGGLPPARVVSASNALPLVVRPAVTAIDVEDDDVTLTVAPPLQAGQRATVVLGRLEGGDPENPADVALVLPPLAEAEAPRATLTLPRGEIPDGRWLVRVQVDGVDSLPEIVGEVYGAPDLTLPPP
jgi:Pvc16 N-terminal domain